MEIFLVRVKHTRIYVELETFTFIWLATLRVSGAREF